MKRSKVFQQLSEFFGTFHDQLRINFDLRNRLIKFQRKQESPLFSRKEVDNFLNVIREQVGISTLSLDQVLESIIRKDKLVSRYLYLEKNNKDLLNAKKDLTQQINTIESYLFAIEEKNNQFFVPINKEIGETKNRICRIEGELIEEAESYSLLKERVIEKEKSMIELKQILEERQLFIGQLGKRIVSDQKNYSTIKNGYKSTIKDLISEYNQLLSDEKPLIIALEAAENDLSSHKAKVSNEVGVINNEITYIEKKIKDLDELIYEEEVLEDSLKSELKSIEKEHELKMLEFLRIRDEVDLHHKSTSDLEQTHNQIDHIEDQSIFDTESMISECSSNLEDIKIENNILRSNIRVQEQKKDNLELETSQTRKKLQHIEQEIESCKYSFSIFSEENKKNQDLLFDYTSLRKSLQFPEDSHPIVVINSCIEHIKNTQFLNSSKSVEVSITPKFLLNAISNISNQLDEIKSKIPL